MYDMSITLLVYLPHFSFCPRFWHKAASPVRALRQDVPRASRIETSHVNTHRWDAIPVYGLWALVQTQRFTQYPRYDPYELEVKLDRRGCWNKKQGVNSKRARTMEIGHLLDLFGPKMITEWKEEKEVKSWSRFQTELLTDISVMTVLIKRVKAIHFKVLLNWEADITLLHSPPWFIMLEHL